jgi:MtaA/CmuA family methyltransferase
MDKMTPYTRVMMALEGKKPDRVPVVPMAREWCSRQVGIEFVEEMESIEKHVYAQTFAVGQFGYDIVWDMFGCHAESEAMGSVLKIAKGYPPSVLTPAVEDYKRDLPKLKLFDPYQNKRMFTILEGIRRLKSRFGGEVPVVGYVQGVMRHASMLRGSEKVMKDMYKEKENLRELCEISLNSLIVYVVAIISAGADIVFVSDPASSGDAVSKKQYEEWGAPLTKRLVDMIKRSGVKTILHICGNTTDRLQLMAGTGIDCLSLDGAVNFEEVRRILGPNFCLMGNVDTTLFAMGEAKAVEEKSKEILQKAGKEGCLLLSAG